MPVVLDLQPIFYSSDSSWMKDRIGSERLSNANLLAAFVRNGFICGGSSDAPIETINPWAGIYSAIKRDPLEEGHTSAQQEALSLYEAISLYTKDGAQTIQSKCGQIRTCYAADFQIYEKDPFLLDIQQLPLLKPIKLYVNGKEISLPSRL